MELVRIPELRDCHGVALSPTAPSLGNKVKKEGVCPGEAGSGDMGRTPMQKIRVDKAQLELELPELWGIKNFQIHYWQKEVWK